VGGRRSKSVYGGQGSGDIAALSKANCFLVVPADREKIEVGESVSVLLRKDIV